MPSDSPEQPTPEEQTPSEDPQPVPEQEMAPTHEEQPQVFPVPGVTTGKPTRRKKARRRRLLVGTLVILAVLAAMAVYLTYYSPPGETVPAVASTGAQVSGTGIHQPVKPAQDPGTPGPSSPGEASGRGPATVSPATSGDGGEGGDSSRVTLAQAGGDLEALQTEVRTLKDALKYAQDQAEELDLELSKRSQKVKELEQQAKTLQEQVEKLQKEMAEAQAAAEQKQKELSDGLKGVSDELANARSSLADHRIKLGDLKEKLTLRERQYQSEIADLRGALGKSQMGQEKLYTAIGEHKARVLALQDELSKTRRERAEHYLDQARAHIMKTGERRGDYQQHLEQALQHLYFAGRVDPDNRRKYRQMAIELLDEQIARLKRDKGAKAEGDKQMDYFLSLRSELSGA